MASSSRSGQIQTQPENAFDGLGPCSAPKSTEPWDIFINHRGPDVKHALATTIYNKLHSLGLHVFLDKDAIEAGDSFPAEIQHAMTTATLHIAIFSPNYAQSAWCLSELTFMLKTGKKVIPIFYQVDPSDLRWSDQGKGKYADAFAVHEKKRRYTREKLDEWKRALYNCSFRNGYPVNNDRDEATVLKNIVNDALKITKTKGLLSVAEHPVALDELVQSFESVARGERVKIMGIVGMGGSGKTTLAKELFNRNFFSFERCGFVSDVRDAASRNALPEKQKKLLKDLGVDDLQFDNVDEGKVVLENRLNGHRALIVLDDVDHIDQLNVLLPNEVKLGSQSMVIVTTRELGVLISWGLSHSCIYNMPELDKPHAEQLFCWHAFLQPSPPAEFETLVQEFLKACDGLPLSLKVLGAQLYGRNAKDYWKSQLDKILRILPGEIKQRLQVSYDALDEEERQMFLDVACFLIREGKHTAIAVWDGSGWSGLHGLETLVNKCLVELVEEKLFKWRGLEVEIRIRMHDQLRDMGREIASRHPPYRLWCPQQINSMKKHSTKIEPIRGIQSTEAFVAFKEYDQLMRKSKRRSKRLRFSNALQILSLKGNEFTEEYASLSKDLVWLRWISFPLRHLPSWLTLKNLRVLELYTAFYLEELWQDNVDPPLQLTELILTGCGKLQRLPSSIKYLQDLKRLVVEFHGSSLSKEFNRLQSLEYLRLYSPVLSSLPDDFGNLTSLRNLSLSNCFNLSTLPDSFSQLIQLEVLDLSCCEELSSLPFDFGNLTSLRDINLVNCNKFTTLPNSFSQLVHLTHLNLYGCEMLSSLPDGFDNLLSLRNLDLASCTRLSMLPDGFGNLTSLEMLTLNSCFELRMLPDSFSQLIHLIDLNLASCKMLSSLPDGFGNLTSLKILQLKNWKQLKRLPDSFSQLIHLIDLDLSICTMLSSLPDGFGNLTSLRILQLGHCKQLKRLPDSFSQLINLTDLDLSYCEMLSSLPDGFDKLTSLRILQLRGCKQLKRLPDSFSKLINLTDLDLSYCEMLSSLPDGFDKLTRLKNLNLENCKQLNMLPYSSVS